MSNNGMCINYNVTNILVYIALGVAILSTIGVFVNRIYLKKGIGIRTIQFAVITILFPFLIVINVLGTLPSSTIAVVAGTIIGYAFSNKDSGK